MPNTPLVIEEKRESTVITLAKIFALLCASPFILIGGIFLGVGLISICALLLGSGAMAAGDLAPWLLAGFILCGVLPAVRTRISGKKQILVLKEKISVLETELSEARLEVIKLNETTEFHRKLEASRPKISTPTGQESKQLDAHEAR
jgi:hypothetical protein